MSLKGSLDATVDDDVTFVFTVENDGTEPVELMFRSGQVADVVVTEDGDHVWRWSDGRMFTQAVEYETLEPGSSLEQTLTWSDPSPGEYDATGSLAADPSVEATTSVTVPE